MLIAISCVACSPDDSSVKGKTLAGEWRYAGYYDVFDDEFNPNDFGVCHEQQISFTTAGTGSYYRKNCDGEISQLDFVWEEIESDFYRITASNGTSSYLTEITFKSKNRIYITLDEDGNAEVYDRR